MKPNLFDNFIGYFSPRQKLSRMGYRARIDLITRKYEGAGKGRRMSGWKTTGASATSEVAFSLRILRDRSRDLVRNNPYAKRAIGVLQSNIVGKGIRLEIKSQDSITEADLKSRWEAWGETTACDYDDMTDYYGLQSLIIRSVCESGECFVRLRRTKRREIMTPNGLIEVPPIKLQLLEGDFLDTIRGVIEVRGSKNRIIQGIEFDKDGKRIAYHMFKRHPGGLDLRMKSTFERVRIPADEIIHVFRVERPGQIRGVPWGSPCIVRLRDFDEYEDANLVRNKVAAMFTAFVHDAEGFESDITDEDKIELGEKMEPGTIEILPPGKEITLSRPPNVQGFGEYASVSLHGIAMGYEVPYEALTGNLSEVNFSSGRMGFLEFARSIDMWRHNMVRPQLNWKAFGWFMNGVRSVSEVKLDRVEAVWTPPKRDMIDPVKEVPAMKMAVRSGFMTRSDVIRAGGSDPDRHYDELALDNKKADGLNLILDSDPRKDPERLERVENEKP